MAKNEEILRTPPNNLPFEQALLAHCVAEGFNETPRLCREAGITQESFYHRPHRVLFDCLTEMRDRGEVVDSLTVANFLQATNQLKKAGGIVYLLDEIFTRLDTPTLFSYYIRQVRDREILRRLIDINLWAIRKAYGEGTNVEQLLHETLEKVFSLNDSENGKETCHVGATVDEIVGEIQRVLKGLEQPRRIVSGFRDLDNLLSGFHEGQMIVLAARPSIGKTSLALNIAENVANRRHHEDATTVLFFSLEMRADELARRIIASRAGIRSWESAGVTNDIQNRLLDASREIKNMSLWIDDVGTVTIQELRARAKHFRNQKQQLGFILIDYLQLIKGRDGRISREQQISEISRNIKAMAQELRIPVLVLSQLNREMDKEHRQPRLSDLRESGSIEQDADIVMLLSEALEEGKKVNEDGLPILDLIVAKHRSGGVGTIKLLFDRGLTRFRNITDHQNF